PTFSPGGADGDGRLILDSHYDGGDSGKIALLAGGGVIVALRGNYALRLTDDGTRDPTFGNAGRAPIGSGIDTLIDDVAIDDVGRIVTIGRTLFPTKFELSR